jgi:hypothetical protein
MRIVIDTDGGFESKISINGKAIEDVTQEFNLSIRAGRKPKIQMVKEIAGKPEFISYYGDDIKKYDETDKNFYKGA